MHKSVLVALVAGVAFVGAASAADDHLVNGYIKKDGVHVAPFMQTNPNATKLDNFSTRGNVNPYTGKAGTAIPYAVKPIEPLKTFEPFKPLQ
jgi:hypothetical protein